MAGFGPHRLGRHPAGPPPSLVVVRRLGVTVEPDDLEVIGSGELPRVAVEGPVVGLLDLIAILEGLLEDPELVPDAVAHRGHVQGGQGVEQAGGQPAQAPVPQPRLDVEGSPGPRPRSRMRPRPGGPGVRVGVERILAQLAPQHVLRREVVDELRVGHVVRPGRPDPALGEAVADGHGQCPVDILGARRLHGGAPLVAQVVSQITLELLQGVTRPRILLRFDGHRANPQLQPGTAYRPWRIRPAGVPG